MSVLPQPCDCKCKQLVTVGDIPPIIDNNGSSINNSVIQTVHVQASKGGLWEWMLVGLVTIAVITIMCAAIFAVGKSSFKSYTTFVQSTVRELDTSPTSVVTNTVTNSVYLPFKVTPTDNSYKKTNVVVAMVQWRPLGVSDGDIVHIKYRLNNRSEEKLSRLDLLVTFFDVNTNIIFNRVVTDGGVSINTPMESNSFRHSDIAVPFTNSTSVKDVSVTVNNVTF